MAGSSTSPQPLPIAWVERLFDRLSGCYGARFADLWRGCDLDNVRRTWAEALAGYSADEIKRGLDACLTHVWPPTLPEFLLLCRPPIDYERAFYEAVEQMRLRGQGRDTWSHPAIYWAAASIGEYDLRRATWSGIRSRWTAALKAEMARGQWPGVPPRLDVLPAPGQCSVPPDVARLRIAAMRDMLAARMVVTA